jgi:hypothetical protein
MEGEELRSRVQILEAKLANISENKNMVNNISESNQTAEQYKSESLTLKVFFFILKFEI